MADEKRRLAAAFAARTTADEPENSRLGTAPPVYQESEKLPTQETTEVSTLDGKISASHVFDVINVPTLHVGDRKVVLRSHGSSSDEETFVVMMEAIHPGVEIRKMVMHWRTRNGDVAGIAKIPPAGDTLGFITVGGEETKIMEHGSPKVKGSGKKKSVVDPSANFFEMGDLKWRGTERLLHAEKGKSRAGDIELVDGNGDVIAVFLNTWNGSPMATKLGKLFLVAEESAAQESNNAMAIRTILSSLVVVLYLSYRDRDGAKQFLKDLGFGVGTYWCTVM